MKGRTKKNENPEDSVMLNAGNTRSKWPEGRVMGKKKEDERDKKGKTV